MNCWRYWANRLTHPLPLSATQRGEFLVKSFLTLFARSAERVVERSNDRVSKLLKGDIRIVRFCKVCKFTHPQPLSAAQRGEFFLIRLPSPSFHAVERGSRTKCRGVSKLLNCFIIFPHAIHNKFMPRIAPKTNACRKHALEHVTKPGVYGQEVFKAAPHLYKIGYGEV